MAKKRIFGQKIAENVKKIEKLKKTKSLGAIFASGSVEVYNLS